MIVSLQTRLLVAVGVLAIAAVAAVALSARQWTRIEFRKFQQHELLTSSVAAPTRAAELRAVLDGRCCAAAVIEEASRRLQADEVFFVIDSTGALVATGGPGAAELRQIVPRQSGDVLSVEALRVRGGQADAITLQLRGRPPAPIALADGGRADVHLIAWPRRDADRPDAAFLGSVDRRLLIATTLVGAIALAVTWAIARRVIGPIRELRHAARDLADGHLSRRVATTGADEVGDLARSFNAMAAELERQQTLRRSMVHDVAHELRTPLTALRCRLESVIDGLAADRDAALAGANEEVQHLSRLVDDLQELALAEARELRLSIGDVALADVAASAARAAGLDGDARLAISIDRALTARADPVRVRQVLLNLLTNAARHTPPGGEIAVRGSRDGGDVAIEVRNTGSALDDDQLARVFDRFYRVDPSRQRSTGGSGLGLSIVKHLVAAQGGRVDGRSDSSGVTFRFTLPAA